MGEILYDQRVKVTSIHLDGDAIAWHRSYMKARNSTLDPTWTEYVLALNERFGDVFEDSMKAIKNLHQTGKVKDYQAKFDRLLTGVNLSIENVISYFLDGLKPELNKAVRMQSPRTIMQAYKLSRSQEEVFKAQEHAWGAKPIGKTQHAILPTPSYQNYQKTHNNISPSTSSFKKPFDSINNRLNKMHNSGRKLFTEAEMDEKRAKGLCFLCDEKYVRVRICKAKKQLFLVEVVDDEETKKEMQGYMEELVPREDVQEVREEGMTISLQAFTGTRGYQTIRVTGYHVRQPLQVLIDTGSTHNFIDEEVTKNLGCNSSSITEQSVSVADGRTIQTSAICKNLS